MFGLAIVTGGVAVAQPGPGFGGPRRLGQDPRFIQDRDAFHFLLQNHDKIRRQVTQRPDGVETLTESDDPQLVPRLQEHVVAMYRRVKEADPIRLRDPLFAEVFRHAAQIEMKHEKTAKGMRVVERSDDAYVAKLIKSHAEVVDRFVKRGFEEAHTDHPVPPREGAAATIPATVPTVATRAPEITDEAAPVACPSAAAEAGCRRLPGRQGGWLWCECLPAGRCGS